MSNLKFSDGISPELRRIARELRNTRPLMAAAGKELERGLRNHFWERDSETNSRGWAKKHFWRKEVASNTALTAVSDSSATVTVASPAFAHKVTGGTISPKRARALSIPLTSQAYLAGSASLFPRKLHREGGRLMDEEDIAQYALAKSVDQEADARAWPEPERIEPAILARARAHLARVTRAQ